MQISTGSSIAITLNKMRQKNFLLVKQMGCRIDVKRVHRGNDYKLKQRVVRWISYEVNIYSNYFGDGAEEDSKLIL